MPEGTNELTHVLIKKTMPYYPDGITRVEVVEGQVVEMSVKWVEIFEREGWGIVTSDPFTLEVEADDATATGEGAEPNSEGNESGDSEGSEGSEEPGGNDGASTGEGDDGSGSDDDGDGDGQEVPEEPQATPRAIELAEELSVDLSGVTGTGTEGLITIEDVRGAVASSPEG